MIVSMSAGERPRVALNDTELLKLLTVPHGAHLEIKGKSLAFPRTQCLPEMR